MNPIDLSPKQLRKAASIKERIDALQKELNKLLGATDQALAETPRRRKMSAAGRRAIAAGAKARWAKYRAVKGRAKPAKRGRRKMSAAAKARLAAIAKARWAKARAAGKTRL